MNDQLRALLMQRMCNGIAKAFCAACDEGNFPASWFAVVTVLMSFLILTG